MVTGTVVFSFSFLRKMGGGSSGPFNLMVVCVAVCDLLLARMT